MHLTRRGMGPVTVALIALLMLGYASMRSTVMQAVGMPSSGHGEVCGDPGMSGMSMPAMVALAATHHAGHPPADNAKHQATCPYCSAAANPLVMADIAPLRIPSSVAFTAFHPVESHGPRGPPEFEAHARGPPVSLTTA